MMTQERRKFRRSCAATKLSPADGGYKMTNASPACGTRVRPSPLVPACVGMSRVFRGVLCAWIPAFAGMTGWRAGMTERGAGY
ncbi:hypothetical protein K7I13_05655 [Brucepastera parasyntrophica]|uniref:hypothetical protein n=1 Tax=Brucepastera parasyntrophica TaxID=2880008 RepID=UPI002109C48E|nr:hypothetical protein [Brucepastera parasyntrophica]ULQ60754.1 hypothetical protein K7I13_05655 [Brucepastera parasyntrophica]